MLRNFFSLYFWVTFVALGIASGLFWLGSFRQVEGEISLLMLPKVETAMVAPGNAQALLFSESFQKATVAELERNASVVESELLEGKEWGKHVEGEVLPDSSVLSLRAMLKTRNETKSLLDVLTKQLVNRLSQFYNVESELDLRVIDGPRFETKVSSWPLFVGASLGSGFIITTIFFLFLSLLERIFSHRAQERAVREAYRISPETFRPKAAVPPYWSKSEETIAPVESQEETFQAAEPLEPSTAAEPEEPEQEEVYQYEEMFTDPNPADVIEMLPEETGVNEEQVIEVSNHPLQSESENDAESQSHGVATGPAPDNLPIFEDLSPLEAATARLFKADIDETTTLQAEAAETELVKTFEEPVKPQTEEPTQEEYKRRLNELLSGRL